MLKKTSDFAAIKSVFAPLKMDFVFDSMVAGLTPAEAFAGEGETPVAVIWEGHSVFFGGGSDDPSEYRQAARFFAEDMLSPAKREELGVVKLAFTSESWKDALLQAFEKSDPGVYGRVLFRHTLQILPQPRALPEGYSIREISESLLDGSLENSEAVIDEVTQMWGLPQHFLQDGFGVCAVKDRVIAGWCTAEYRSRNACGIGIETVEAHQKQGIATAMAAEMVEKCRQVDVTPHWDSWRRNTPSVRVAEKCGFEKVHDYDVVFVRF